MPPNHTHKITHSSAMHNQNMNVIREFSKKLLTIKSVKWFWTTSILANCSYLIGTVPILTQEKGRKKSNFIMCSYFCKNLPVVMYRKFWNVPIFKDIPPICPYF